ncbi:Protein of unknown function DUF2569 [Paenibacillus curdlanolyticus YK9]|uniref:Uncharacterized protein n=1 Tax=Paenibacillus curdlanolyticus YK9 TaxID=717606 RepID=E0IF20_9BACL|nr:Protein of unknown function DUF2569 [Paenibacillus curdlanolyticus YK9]
MNVNRIAGWLFLYIIFVVFSIIQSIKSVVSVMNGGLGEAAASWGLPTNDALIIELLGLVVLILSIISVKLIYSRKRHVPKMIIAFEIIYLVVLIYEYMKLSGSEAQVPDSWLIVGIIVKIIWIDYFVRSKRVKMTFVH